MDWKRPSRIFNSAIGADIKAPIKAPKETAEEETVEVIEDEEVVEDAPLKKAAKATPVEEEAEVSLSAPTSDDEVEALIKGISSTEKAASDDSLDEFEFDSEDEDSFFED